ncbi:hypothetical protein [Treponema zioleckii]|uniref:hypothetical protein n=1 Tax=Treponema zioleckii TaxID=331680 RepID=UPI00168BE072|nr:hypothetical protein [Treponema zioleckii]
MGFLSIAGFGKSKEEKFWNWFCKNSAEIFDFEKDQESVFDKIQAELGKIDVNLTFEISSKKGGKRDFILSADGILSVFPAVEALFSKKPDLPEWNFVKFRPRRAIGNSIRFGNIELFPRDVRFLLVDDDDEKIGIVLFLNGYDGSSLFNQIGFLFLDESLGEFDVETKVGGISFVGFESEHFEKSKPIEELPATFDKAKAGKNVLS